MNLKLSFLDQVAGSGNTDFYTLRGVATGNGAKGERDSKGRFLVYEKTSERQS